MLKEDEMKALQLTLPTVNIYNQIVTMIARLIKTLMVVFTISAGMVSPSCAPASALEDWSENDPHAGLTIFDKISHQEMVKVTLKGNLDSMINIRNTNHYSAAEFTYEDANGIDQNYNIKVKPRGKFRRRVCDMPPLKIKFSKDQLEAAGLSKHNDIKLVTHCLDDPNYNEKLVLKEYLTYKLYNQLNPYSFRVQLIKVTYQDKHDKKYKRTQLGFLIEDVDELADRMRGKECDDCMGLSAAHLNTSQEKIASLFQFMVGNTDWSLQMSRNVKFIKMHNDLHTPIPYDFDFSVLVNAPYLRPNSDIKQSKNMERIYMGLDTDIEKVYGTISYFKTKRDELIDTIRDFHYLDKDERFAIELYIETFFDNVDSKGKAEKYLFKYGQLSGVR